MKTVLYSRVSTADQTLEHQRTQAEAAGFHIEEVVADHGVSGVHTALRDRPEGRRLFDMLRQGDTLVVRWVEACIAHAQANENGTKYRGRKPTFKRRQFMLVQELLSQGVAIGAIAKTTGLNRQSIYRIRASPERQLAALEAWYPRGAVNPRREPMMHLWRVL